MRPPFPTMRVVREMIEVVALTGRDRAESRMKKFNPDPNLPDDLSIHQVRLRPAIKRALAAAGLKTLGDVRKTSDAMLFSIQSLGWKSVMRLRIELGHRNSRELTTGGGLSPEQKAR
jgi:DNA-directed RNA polymerase alpha subunit